MYGDNYEDNDLTTSGKETEASRKRKATAENATKEYAKYDWFELADSGKVCLDSRFSILSYFKCLDITLLDCITPNLIEEAF